METLGNHLRGAPLRPCLSPAGLGGWGGLGWSGVGGLGSPDMEEELAHAFGAPFLAQLVFLHFEQAMARWRASSRVAGPFWLRFGLCLADGQYWNGELVAEPGDPVAESLGNLVVGGWWAWWLPPVESGPGFHELECPDSTTPRILLAP